jgi:hypothetical protein
VNREVFGPGGAKECHKKGHIEDADGDGDLDMVLHFKVQDAGIKAGDTEAKLKGKANGVLIEGTDSVNVVGVKPAPSLNPKSKLSNSWGGIKSKY